MHKHVKRLGTILLSASIVAVAAACGHTTPSTETTSSGTANATSTSVVVSLSGSTIDFHDVRGLTWSSPLIIQGKVDHVMPAQRFPATDGPLGTQTPRVYYDQQIYTDYVIDVEKEFRGDAPDTITVRQMGGTVGSVTLTADGYATMNAGDEFVLFLRRPRTPQPGDAYWVTGAAQGYWKVNGTQVVPSIRSYPTLPANAVGQTIADAIKQGPPANLPTDPVSLADAPPGVDLPSVATPVTH